MKSVIVKSKISTFKIDGKRLIINGASVPFRLIDMLIITQDCEISSKDIVSLASENIAVLFISSTNRHFALTLPQFAKNSELKLAQYRTSTQNSMEFARWILRHKFISHKESLAKFDISLDIDEALNSLQNAPTKQSLLGLEGCVARRYFSEYFGLFPRNLAKGERSKHPPQDPINAMLSFVYTIFYNQITVGLYMGGFDPSISYLHTPNRSHYALASDLLEFFRAEINGFVAGLFLDKLFCIDDFCAKGGVYLKSEARGRLWEHFNPFAKELEPKISEKMSDLKFLINKLCA
ncbi:CRISPR-associated endonuclease Cas1 [Campylobacter sp. VBCF_05 NA6]|uniref:CRISPR-associated endonuclease Cas1 n=1 Tax=unclassified Campylobacter TaxID=2593542 RepID=UPI0022EA0773|nr:MULTISPECIES: CRISPR-associated endonuclease Cas1 [unclassified Campylobacter]MDA3057096.1 CRISPR-associated endonuclease Cas1 [Campylobacter sp. VBCF_04 NA7]MDA3059470.1 CRISPR-associated endonuclease Cas1 [Campylobacter sp. VBCF_05 NA6]